MVLTKSERQLFIFCIAVLVGCFVIVGLFSGFQFEDKKFKTFLIVTAFVLIFNAVVLDSIRFLVHALILAFKKSDPSADYVSETYLDHHRPTRSEFLRLRIESLKEELRLTPEHRSESQNVTYKAVCQDESLYFRYFVLLLFIIVHSFDELSFYNTSIITATLTGSKSQFGFATKNIKRIEDVYQFANETLVIGLSDGKNYNDLPIEEPGWIHREIAKLLGVVRLRQMRYLNVKASLRGEDVAFSEENYTTSWRSDLRYLPYTKLYWRIFQPWQYMTTKSYIFSRFMSGVYSDNLNYYPEHSGYMALLSRNREEGEQIIKFLKKCKWIDSKTAAIFIDFTLYNADANLFSFVHIMVEQTPFGGVNTIVDVKTASLLFNINDLSYGDIFLYVLYLLHFIGLCKALIVKAWNEPKSLLKPWNIFNFIIIILNILLVSMIYLQEVLMIDLMEAIETSDKVEFLDFRAPVRIHQLAIFFAALLIALSTLRVWKTLYFYNNFLLFTQTLTIASKSLTNTGFLTATFLFGFCLSALIANSGYNASFRSMAKTLTSAMSLSFGFQSTTTPEDLSYGGKVLGFALYISLMIAVHIILVNWFTTQVAHYYKRVLRAEKVKYKSVPHLGFIPFLRMEYRSVLQWFSRIFRKLRKPKKRQLSVTESIEEILDKIEAAAAAKGVDVEERELMDLDKLRLITLILNAQLELLDREIAKLEIEIDSDEETKEETSTSKRSANKTN